MILLVHCNCRQQQTSLAQTLCTWQNTSPSPPGDFKLIDGPFAVVVVDEVFVTHADALLVSRDATICQVAHYTVKKVINISHCLPGPKGHVNLTMVLKQLGLALWTLKSQRIEQRPFIRGDGHLLLVHADLQLRKASLPLHGTKLCDLHNALKIFWSKMEQCLVNWKQLLFISFKGVTIYCNIAIQKCSMHCG